MTILSILAALIPLQTAEGESATSSAPYLVGGTALVILLALLLALLAFGKGREHS